MAMACANGFEEGARVRRACPPRSQPGLPLRRPTTGSCSSKRSSGDASRLCAQQFKRRRAFTPAERAVDVRNEEQLRIEAGLRARPAQSQAPCRRHPRQCAGLRDLAADGAAHGLHVFWGSFHFPDSRFHIPHYLGGRPWTFTISHIIRISSGSHQYLIRIRHTLPKYSSTVLAFDFAGRKASTVRFQFTPRRRAFSVCLGKPTMIAQFSTSGQRPSESFYNSHTESANCVRRDGIFDFEHILFGKLCVLWKMTVTGRHSPGCDFASTSHPSLQGK